MHWSNFIKVQYIFQKGPLTEDCPFRMADERRWSCYNSIYTIFLEKERLLWMKFSFQSDQGCLGDLWVRLLSKFSSGGLTNVTPRVGQSWAPPQRGMACFARLPGRRCRDTRLHTCPGALTCEPSITVAPPHLDGVSWRGAVLRSPLQPALPFFSPAPLSPTANVFSCAQSTYGQKEAWMHIEQCSAQVLRNVLRVLLFILEFYPKYVYMLPVIDISEL